MKDVMLQCQLPNQMRVWGVGIWGLRFTVYSLRFRGLGVEGLGFTV